MQGPLLALVPKREPPSNISYYAEEHNARPTLPIHYNRAPDPIRRTENSARFSRFNRNTSRMPIAFFYDPGYKMGGIERWHLFGAHAAVGSRRPWSSVPRGRIHAFQTMLPQRRLIPGAAADDATNIMGG